MTKVTSKTNANSAGASKVGRIARRHTELAVTTLVDVTADATATSASRVSAATALLDRGWGKAAQASASDQQSAPTSAITRLVRTFVTPEDIRRRRATQETAGDDEAPDDG